MQFTPSCNETKKIIAKVTSEELSCGRYLVPFFMMKNIAKGYQRIYTDDSKMNSGAGIFSEDSLVFQITEALSTLNALGNIDIFVYSQAAFLSLVNQHYSSRVVDSWAI